MKTNILTQEKAIELGWNKLEVITADMLDGYTSIGNYAFAWYNLVSVTIPKSVRSIGGNAFSWCTSLKNIVIPNSVTSIEWNAFFNCGNLASIEIPNSVTYIGMGAFESCTALTSVRIPDSVTNIGLDTFYRCKNLVSLIIKGTTYKKHIVKNDKCKAYKGFNADMTCRGFQYEEGKTYEFDGEPILCRCGFHACLNLADVFSHYCGKFGKSIVVCEVELEGVTCERGIDSKVVAKKITIGKRIL